MELAFNKDKLVNEQIYVHQLEGEMFSLKDRLAKTTNDSDDILTHKQREIKLKMERVLRLEVGPNTWESFPNSFLSTLAQNMTFLDLMLVDDAWTPHVLCATSCLTPSSWEHLTFFP